MTALSAFGYIVVESYTGTGYRGVDRQPWEVIDTAFYDKSLPPQIKKPYEEAKRLRGLWWPTLPTESEAQRLLAFTRRHQAGAELLAVDCPYLRRNGALPQQADVGGMELLGMRTYLVPTESTSQGYKP